MKRPEATVNASVSSTASGERISHRNSSLTLVCAILLAGLGSVGGRAGRKKTGMAKTVVATPSHRTLWVTSAGPRTQAGMMSEAAIPPHEFERDVIVVAIALVFGENHSLENRTGTFVMKGQARPERICPVMARPRLLIRVPAYFNHDERIMRAAPVQREYLEPLFIANAVGKLAKNAQNSHVVANQLIVDTFELKWMATESMTTAKAVKDQITRIDSAQMRKKP